MPSVAYMTHPLGDREDDDWRNNLANAMDWFSFLVQVTRWAISCPWYAYAVAIQDAYHRPRMLVDQVELVARADILVMVGGRMAPHMHIELRGAQRRIGGAVPILDLLHLGYRVPWDAIDRVTQDIRAVTATLDLE